MLGNTSGSKTFDVGENLDTSSDVTCVVNLFGVADFTIFNGVPWAISQGPHGPCAVGESN